MRELYSSKLKTPYKLSRTRLENFVKCPRCFYMQEKLGVKKPSMPAFTLNIAVDGLLKKEFDIRRARGVAHPLMKEYGIKAVPFRHKDMNVWRENFQGIRFLHKSTNLLITGAIDDVWENKKGELYIVDYKATSKKDGINFEDRKKNPYYGAYRRQMDIYQWLFRKNGFKVSDTGYFVFCNGRKDKKAFDGKLEFDGEGVAYKGNDGGVGKVIVEAKKCLNKRKMPESNDNCEYCEYVAKIRDIKP